MKELTIRIIETQLGAREKNGKYQGKLLTVSNTYIIAGDRNSGFSKIYVGFNEMNWAEATDGKNTYTIYDCNQSLQLFHKSKGVHHITIGIFKDGNYRCNYTSIIEII